MKIRRRLASFLRRRHEEREMQQGTNLPRELPARRLPARVDPVVALRAERFFQ